MGGRGGIRTTFCEGVCVCFSYMYEMQRNFFDFMAFSSVVMCAYMRAYSMGVCVCVVCVNYSRGR